MVGTVRFENMHEVVELSQVFGVRVFTCDSKTVAEFGGFISTKMVFDGETEVVDVIMVHPDYWNTLRERSEQYLVAMLLHERGHVVLDHNAKKDKMSPFVRSVTFIPMEMQADAFCYMPNNNHDDLIKAIDICVEITKQKGLKYDLSGKFAIWLRKAIIRRHKKHSQRRAVKNTGL